MIAAASIPYIWRDPAASPRRVTLTRVILAGTGDEPDSWDSPWARPPATGRSWPSYRLKGCGTEAAYRRHQRNGERPCAECTHANRRRQRGRRAMAEAS